MRFKATDRKCLEEKAQTEQKISQSLSKEAKHSHTVLHFTHFFPISCTA